jgi:hypothetical protein
VALSGELLALHHKEDDYQGDETLVGMAIQDREVHMVSAPTKTGKSTIIEAVVKILPDSALASSITDRHRKPGDPLTASFQTLDEGMTSNKIKYLINNEEVVNFAVSPTGFIYGSLPEGYPALHNYLPMLPNGVPQMRKAGFKRDTHSYVTLPGNAWHAVLGPNPNVGRMEEAVVNLTYAQEHADELEFIRNRIGKDGLAHAANVLINISVGSGVGDDKDKALEDIAEMLAIAKDLAVRSK